MTTLGARLERALLPPAAERHKLLDGHSIDPVPDADRHGKPFTLFTMWFGFNASIIGIAGGAVAIQQGLSVWLAILASLVGILVGTVFMALHSAQGPKMGLPQMVQTRAQFGLYGAVLPTAGAVLNNFIFYLLTVVLVYSGVQGYWHLSSAAAMTIACLVTWVITAVGYSLIHWANRLVTAAAVVLFVIFTIRVIQHIGTARYHSHSTLAGFFFVLTFFVAGQVTWAPYVSDFSRYLPRNTDPRQVFWYTTLGNGISAFLIALVGILGGTFALSSINADTVGFAGHLWSPVTSVVTITILVMLMLLNSGNLYSTFMSSVTAVSVRGGRLPGGVLRVIITAGYSALAGVLALALASSFLTDMGNLVSNMLYILAPWSMINLVDYYVIRKADYDVDSLVTRGGRYGLFNVQTVTIFLVALAAEIPFIDSAYPVFEGSAARALGGVNIGWAVGFLVSGALYYAASRWSVLPGWARVAEVHGATVNVDPLPVRVSPVSVEA